MTTQNSELIAVLTEGISEYVDQTVEDRLEEGMSRVSRMFAYEDREWTSLTNIATGETPGLDLDQLKEISGRIRENLAGSPLVKRSIELRKSYVFSKGVNWPRVDSGSRGRKSGYQMFSENEVTQDTLLSSEAYETLERTAATDGLVVLVGEDATKELRPLVLREITATYHNPDHQDEIWAYLRSWSVKKDDYTSEERNVRYVTSRAPAVVKKLAKIDKYEVAKGFTAFDQRFNHQSGFAFGIPDACSAVVWSRIYTELINNGKIVTDALARFAFQLTGKAGKSKATVRAAVSDRGQAGGMAVMPEGTALQALSSAGKAYDFDGIRPVAAMIASGMEVSLVHLLSDPGAAGSSYGSAANLDLPTTNSIRMRQQLWVSFFTRILKWTGLSDFEISFPSLEDADPYREMQLLILMWSNGLLHPDEARARGLDISQIKPLHNDVPEGVVPPNSTEAIERGLAQAEKLAATTAAPDQGKSTGAGKTDSTTSNDLSSKK